MSNNTLKKAINDMNKYYVIKLAYDHGFWSEEKQDFVGWLYASKYTCEPVTEYKNEELIKCNEGGFNLHNAAMKKPVTIIEIYEHI